MMLHVLTGCGGRRPCGGHLIEQTPQRNAASAVGDIRLRGMMLWCAMVRADGDDAVVCAIIRAEGDDALVCNGACRWG